jgi:hypothetical protein
MEGGYQLALHSGSRIHTQGQNEATIFEGQVQSKFGGEVCGIRVNVRN